MSGSTVSVWISVEYQVGGGDPSERIRNATKMEHCEMYCKRLDMPALPQPGMRIFPTAIDTDGEESGVGCLVVMDWISYLEAERCFIVVAAQDEAFPFIENGWLEGPADEHAFV